MGIRNYFVSKYSGIKYHQIEKENRNNEATPLAMNHFFGIFQLWSMGLAASTAYFCWEHVLHKIRNIQESTKFVYQYLP